MQRCPCCLALWWYLQCARGLIVWEGAPRGSLTLQRSVLLLALVLFTPAAPPSRPLVARSKPLSLLLGAAGTEMMSHFLILKGKRSWVVNTLWSVEGQEGGCYMLQSCLCSPLSSMELPCALYSLCGTLFVF